ncbi:filamentous hemagglutinin, partial [Photorhabdus luminescens]
TTLSRDTDHANNALSPIFDKEKEQQRLRQAQLIGEISAQVIDIASTEGAIIATKAAHAKLENISDPDREAARKKLENAGKTNITPEQIKDQIYKTAYNQALNESGLGTGGKYHTALQAATAAIQGLAGGNIGQALAGGASPYLAGVIKDLTTDPKTHQVDVVTNTLAHAILGAVAAEVSGNNALAGAAGTASGELAARELMKHIHGENVKVSDLSEEEKQTISTLSTLAAGLAGGIAGDSTGSAVTGAQAGKNAVENNFLSVKDIEEYLDKSSKAKTEDEKARLLDALKQKDAENQALAETTNISMNDQKKELAALKAKRNAADCNAQCQALVDYSIAQLEPVTNDQERYKYNMGIGALLGAVEGLTELNGAGKSNKGTSSAVKPENSSALDKIAKGSNWSVGEGKYSPKNQGTVTNVEHPTGKFDGKSLPNNQLVKNVDEKFEIKALPDMHGKEHITAVKGDAKIPVDKVELYMRGKAAGDLDALKKEYNSLKELRIKSQKEFAKNPENKANLSILEKKIHNVERSQEMNKVLNNAGLPDTKVNNHMIIDKLLDSAKSVTPENRKTSVVVSGNNGEVRVYATWTILPDGSKRLATVQTGTFK